MVLLAITLILIITIIGYHYAKQKRYNIKWKIMNFKKFVLKFATSYYYFDDIIKLEDFDIDNILIDEKSHENILIYSISFKTLIDPKPLRIRIDKRDGFIRIYDGTRYLTLFGSEEYEAIHNRLGIL